MLRRFASLSLNNHRVRRQVPVVEDHCLDDTLYTMLSWKVSWLAEYKDSKQQPNVSDNTNGVANLLNVASEYSDFEAYKAVFKELLLYEAWAQIQREFSINDRDLRSVLFDVSFVIPRIFKVEVSVKPLHFVMIKCERIITDSDFQNRTYQKTGGYGIVVIKVRKENNESCTLLKFCYIENHEITRVRMREFLTAEFEFIRTLRLTLLVQLDEDQKIISLADIKLKIITNIRPMLRMFCTLKSLKTSPLLPAVLNPANFDFTLEKLPYDVRQMPSLSKLNLAQQNAVINCTQLCLGLQPNIALIHGPPGTGKSHVIINLIEHIFETSRLGKRPKVLVCAPSNFAVDQLVERLLDLKERMENAASEVTLSIIRVGKMSEYNVKLLKRVSLDDIVESRLKNLRPFRLHKYQKPVEEGSILREADIICSTLSSSVLESMKNTFLSDRLTEPKLTCCIIDEASQSCEPEILIPLQLNLSKIVLVGDHKQLPATVISEVSKGKGLGKSLFSRIHCCWEPNDKQLESQSPIYFLSTQYRMHPSIVCWPNKSFYGDLLKTDYQEPENSPLEPYITIDHRFTEDPDKHESNSSEADLVIGLTMSVLKADSCADYSVGIITPYNHQAKLIISKLGKRCNCEKIRSQIKVSTIDSFQGSEKDVMIMSCVRSEKVGFLADKQRLNVALTRAKHSMIICANFNAFKNNPHWGSLIEDSKLRNTHICLNDKGIKYAISKIFKPNETCKVASADIQ